MVMRRVQSFPAYYKTPAEYQSAFTFGNTVTKAHDGEKSEQETEDHRPIQSPRHHSSTGESTRKPFKDQVREDLKK